MDKNNGRGRLDYMWFWGSFDLWELRFFDGYFLWLMYCDSVLWCLSHFGSNFNTSRCHLNLEVVIHKHLLAVTNFAILTKRLGGNQSEPKSGSHIQKSLSSSLTRGHILFTISQKQCTKEKIFPRGCGLFCCMCLWRRQFHTKKQGHKDICGQFFLHGTQRK